VTGCIYPVDNRNALRFPQVPTLSFRLFSESRWVNPPIQSHAASLCQVSVAIVYGFIQQEAKLCWDDRERERERERERVLIS